LLVGAILLVPEFGMEVIQGMAQQFLGDRNIAENQSLFNTDFGFIMAPIGFFGLCLFFALPVFVWGSWFGWTKNRGDWLTLSAYAWVLFVLSIFRVRFAGHLALPTAVGTGFAFVWLTAKVGTLSVPGVGNTEESTERRSWARSDQSETSQSDDRDLKSTVSVLVAIFLLVGGLGAVITPARADALTHDQSAVTATQEMDEYAAAHDLQWPENYVFSVWDHNRLYNAFISGESRSYGYTQRNFDEFLASTDNAVWYQRLQDRAGFVVVTERPDFRNAPDATIYAQLQREWGIDTHYGVLYAADDGRKAFAIVPGTVVNGSATGETVTVSGTMEFNDRTREVSTTAPVENGTYSVRISTPGTYTVGNETVTVTEDDVLTSS
jgi:dolichyl-diphosphooligosaccharide--protein glycosyltransferase